MIEVRQRSVALILARELAVNLATPMWVWDETGELVYLNEQAEAILGLGPNAANVQRLEELPEQFQIEDVDGRPVEWSDLPSAVVLKDRRPSHRVVRITGLDGKRRTVAATAFPLFARVDEFVGSVAVFWQLDEES